jgi:hypothetical protein
LEPSVDAIYLFEMANYIIVELNFYKQNHKLSFSLANNE